MAKPIYTAKATVTGGRAEGHGVTDDGALDVQLRPPNEGGGTNPEQLFAVGYAACFEGAIGVLGRRERVEVGDVSIDSQVSLIPTEERGFKIGVVLDVTLPQVERSGGRRAHRARRAPGLPVLERHAREHRRRAQREREIDGVKTRAVAPISVERWRFVHGDRSGGCSSRRSSCLGAVVLRNLGVVPPVLPSVWEYAYNGAELLATAICALRALPLVRAANAPRGRPSRSACSASPPVTSTGRWRSPTTPRRRIRRSPTPAT